MADSLAKIISIHSFRGGTGKSNLSANLSVLVARSGKRVGIIDTDIQSPGVHVLFNVDSNDVKHSLNDYLWGKCGIEECAVDVTDCVQADDHAESSALFLIPSSIRPGEIAKVLREGYDVGLLNDGFQELIEKLELDYLFIDTHPGVNEETLLSIAISDALLLIMRPDNQDFQGTAVTVELARRLEVSNMLIVLNKVPPGLDVEALKEQVRSGYGAEVTEVLPLNNEIAQLGSRGIFSLHQPEHPFSSRVRRIAARLMS